MRTRVQPGTSVAGTKTRKQAAVFFLLLGKPQPLCVFSEWKQLVRERVFSDCVESPQCKFRKLA